MMMRRRINIVFIVLVGLWSVVSVGAFLGGGAMMRSMDRLDNEDHRMTLRSGRQRGVIDKVERLLISAHAIGGGSAHELRRVVDQFRDTFEDDPAFQFGPGAEHSPVADIHTLHETLLGLTRDPGGRLDRVGAMMILAGMPDIRQTVEGVWEARHGSIELARASLRIRIRVMWTGMAIAFVVLLGASYFYVSRAVLRIVRSVEDLLRASRHIGKDRNGLAALAVGVDEISELAGAYATMRVELSQSEQHTMEVLHQVAATLSHELINTIATIDAQLSRIERSSAGDTSVASPLYEIRASLQRMVGTVDSLNRMRSVVLTDYIPGVKMIDLSKSAESGASESGGVVVVESLKKKTTT